eukprot:4913366-Alexandrium_andersonii.AAC.1
MLINRCTRGDLHAFEALRLLPKPLLVGGLVDAVKDGARVIGVCIFNNVCPRPASKCLTNSRGRRRDRGHVVCWLRDHAAQNARVAPVRGASRARCAAPSGGARGKRGLPRGGWGSKQGGAQGWSTL